MACFAYAVWIGYGCDVVPIQTLRESMAEFVTQAESGRAFLIRRHAESLAILRPVGETDGAEDVPVSRFRASLPFWLKRARRAPLGLTWRGTRIAIVEGTPATRSQGDEP